MCGQAEKLWVGAVVLPLEPSSESPAGLVSEAGSGASPRVSGSEFAFLTSFRVMLRLLRWATTLRTTGLELPWAQVLAT